MLRRIPLTPQVESLPITVPFVAPDELERRRGAPFRLRLGANESAFGVSPAAQGVLKSAHQLASWYGDPLSYELRCELAQELGVAPNQLLVAAGIDEILGLVSRVCLEPGSPVVASSGSYPTFSYFAAGHGGALCLVPYREGHNDPEALLAESKKQQARLLYLANPDNPTGTFLEAKQVAELLERLPENCLLVLDEAYADFVPKERMLPLEADDSRVVRLRTFSKAHGLAGCRVGYAIGSEELMRAFDKVRVQFSVNRIGQAAALASLRDPAFLAQVIAEVTAGRKHYQALAEELSLGTLPSLTNFVAFDLGHARKARRVMEGLLDQGCFVRMPNSAPLDRYIRVTVGVKSDREVFAELLAETLRKLE